MIPTAETITGWMSCDKLHLHMSAYSVVRFSVLANHIRPQNFVTSLYEKFRAEKLLYKEVTEL